MLSTALTVGCSSPLYIWQTHTTATPRPPAFDVAELAGPVATFTVVTPGALQGFGPSLSRALTRAVSNASPPLRELPAYQVASMLTEHGLVSDYADLLVNFPKNGILDRERLQRLGTALGCHYVLLPGIAAFSQVVADRFEIGGIKLLRNQITILRLWLQIWDARTGSMLWESAGEITVASDILSAGRSVPLHDVAAKLWLAMINDGIAGRTKSGTLLSY
ncbi:MAG TPA: hypothetical protein VMS64_35050 [Candidatus Methylomirabilis sp.]|nr:hypothetical protein [Candidatus Methylomirabilis sp.]